MPTYEELSAVQHASFQVRASLVFLNNPDLKDVNLGEKADAVQDFIAENKDNFNSLSEDKLNTFKDSLQAFADGIQKYKDYYQANPLKEGNLFGQKSLADLKEAETPLSHLGELIKNNRSKEEIADTNNRDQLLDSFQAIDQKVAELDNNARGLSDKSQAGANSIKNGLTSLKDKLGQYFSKNKDDKEEKKTFTSEAQRELTDEVNELQKKMDETNAIPEASNVKRAKSLFDSSFLKTLAENLSKIKPASKEKNVEVEHLGAIVEEKVKDKGDVKVEVDDELKDEIKEDIKKEVKEEVKQEVKEQVKVEEKKEEVKERAKEENKEEVKPEPVNAPKEEPRKAEKKSEPSSAPQKVKSAPVKRLNYNDIKELYERIDKNDSAFVRSSEEFRRTKSALKGALKVFEDNIDPKNREKSIADINKNGLSREQRLKVNDKLREAFEYADTYVSKKGKEVNSSDRAAIRFGMMNDVNNSLQEQLAISNNESGIKEYTNAQAAEEIIARARENYDPNMSDHKKARILASLRYAEKLKQNGDLAFNSVKATKEIDDESETIYWKMQTTPLNKKAKYLVDADKTKSLSERVKPIKQKPVNSAPTL